MRDSCHRCTPLDETSIVHPRSALRLMVCTRINECTRMDECALLTLGTSALSAMGAFLILTHPSLSIDALALILMLYECTNMHWIAHESALYPSPSVALYLYSAS